MLNSGKQLNYAFGLNIGEHKGLRIVQHGGALGGYRAVMIRFPDERLSVIVLANVSSAQPRELAMQIADLHLADRYVASGDTPAKADSDVEPPKAVRVSRRLRTSTSNCPPQLPVVSPTAVCSWKSPAAMLTTGPPPTVPPLTIIPPPEAVTSARKSLAVADPRLRNRRV